MKHILIIEDDENHRLLYRQELEAEGYEILEAGCCESALEQLASSQIDLIILDLLLPKNTTSLELLEQILIKQRDLHVIINTADASFRSDFKTWGADDYLVKSSDLTELKKAVARYLGNGVNNGVNST